MYTAVTSSFLRVTGLKISHPCWSVSNSSFVTCMLTFIRYIEVYFMFGLLDCVRYNEDFVISRFCSIRFTVILTGLKKIVRYTKVPLYKNRKARNVKCKCSH